MSDKKYSSPNKDEKPRSRVLFFIWNNAPRFALVAFIAVIYVLFGVIGTKKGELEAAKKEAQKEQKKLVNAVVLAVEPRVVQDTINLPGNIEAWSTLNLVAKVSGTITEVVVQEGDRLQAGDVIARIEEDDYQIALDAAKAAYALASSEFRRNQEMLKKKVIPPANLETSETNLLKAKTDLDMAKLQLSRCQITAPVPSVVRKLDAKVGGYLAVGDPIGQLLELDQVKAVIGIPESDVDAVRKIKEVDLTIQALNNKTFTGSAYFLSPSPETTAYLYRFELALENPDHVILPGMFCRANIIKETIDQALMVPLYSVVSRGEKQYVYVAEGDTVRRQEVELGIIDQWQIQVVKGLEPGAKIIIEGHRDVEDGQLVNIVKVVTDPGEILL